MLPLSNVSIRRRIRLLIANHSWVKFICKSYCFYYCPTLLDKLILTIVEKKSRAKLISNTGQDNRKFFRLTVKQRNFILCGILHKGRHQKIIQPIDLFIIYKKIL
jgi:hypothetical protein